MNSAWTDSPCRCSSSAATAESTPPDMPTMTVSGELGREGGMRRIIPAPAARRRLHQHLPHLGFLHAGLPYFIEEVQIAANHGRIVHVRDAVPAVSLQPIHQSLVVLDDEGARTRGIFQA